MSTMPDQECSVDPTSGVDPAAAPGLARYAGVDTHADTHHVAVVDGLGRRLADCEFVTTSAGYRQLLAWLLTHGQVSGVGVEGTGCYGAGLTAVLTAAGLAVFEVDRPDRAARRRRGKSDPEDAYARGDRGRRGPGDRAAQAQNWNGGSDPGDPGGSPLSDQGPYVDRQPAPRAAHHRPRRLAGPGPGTAAA